MTWFRPVGEPADREAMIAGLGPRIDLLAGFSDGGTEVAMVIDYAGEAGITTPGTGSWAPSDTYSRPRRVTSP